MNKKNKAVQKNPDEVVIYTRNTLKDLPEEYEVRQNTRLLKEQCEKEEYEVSKIYYERSSLDSNNPKPVLRQMLKDAASSSWGSVVVRDVLTLSTDGAELQRIERELAGYGVQLISEYEPFDTSTELGLRVFKCMCKLINTDTRRMAAIQDIPISYVAGWEIHRENERRESIVK